MVSLSDSNPLTSVSTWTISPFTEVVVQCSTTTTTMSKSLLPSQPWKWLYLSSSSSLWLQNSAVFSVSSCYRLLYLLLPPSLATPPSFPPLLFLLLLSSQTEKLLSLLSSGLGCQTCHQRKERESGEKIFMVGASVDFYVTERCCCSCKYMSIIVECYQLHSKYCYY